MFYFYFKLGVRQSQWNTICPRGWQLSFKRFDFTYFALVLSNDYPPVLLVSYLQGFTKYTQTNQATSTLLWSSWAPLTLGNTAGSVLVWKLEVHFSVLRGRNRDFWKQWCIATTFASRLALISHHLTTWMPSFKSETVPPCYQTKTRTSIQLWRRQYVYTDTHRPNVREWSCDTRFHVC